MFCFVVLFLSSMEIKFLLNFLWNPTQFKIQQPELQHGFLFTEHH